MLVDEHARVTRVEVQPAHDLPVVALGVDQQTGRCARRRACGTATRRSGTAPRSRPAGRRCRGSCPRGPRIVSREKEPIASYQGGTSSPSPAAARWKKGSVPSRSATAAFSSTKRGSSPRLCLQALEDVRHRLHQQAAPAAGEDDRVQVVVLLGVVGADLDEEGLRLLGGQRAQQPRAGALPGPARAGVEQLHGLRATTTKTQALRRRCSSLHTRSTPRISDWNSKASAGRRRRGNGVPERVLDDLQAHRGDAHDALEALDHEARAVHRALEARAGPAPEVDGIGVVDHHAVGGEQDPPARTQRPEGLGQVELGRVHVLEHLRGQHGVEARVAAAAAIRRAPVGRRHEGCPGGRRPRSPRAARRDGGRAARRSRSRARGPRAGPAGAAPSPRCPSAARRRCS